MPDLQYAVFPKLSVCAGSLAWVEVPVAGLHHGNCLLNRGGGDRPLVADRNEVV